ncbi:hypothetical protein [Glaciecola sp. 1036]|uniref:hypothetical protein n=1 Tax=Alteromonadaceae TaxID=72275 RepID=UPI003CFD153E
MKIPSYFIPIRTTPVKNEKNTAVNMDKTDTNTDATKQTMIVPVKRQEKRKGEDRRKRNIKPLLDTRSGRDRREDKARPKVDTKA